MESVLFYDEIKKFMFCLKMIFHRKKYILLILLVFTCTLFGYLFLAPEIIDLELNSTYDFECSNNVSSMARRHICFKEPHFFFVETSGSSVLNVRQACAIESTAHHNPSINIYVLMTAKKKLDFEHNLMKRIKKLENVHYIRTSIDALVYGSPIFKWYRQGRWKKSVWKVSHISDALRFLLMYKYGGAYLDLDIVTFRPLGHLKNAAVTENWDRVAAGILFFDKQHELLRRCMYDFAQNYDPYNFVNNGPGIFTNNIKKYCDTKITSKVSGSHCGITILPPEAAFPITYDKWEDYFMPSTEKDVSAVFNSSYMIHVWNKFSKVYKLVVGKNSLYELAIKQQCPLSYSYAVEVGYI